MRRILIGMMTAAVSAGGVGNAEAEAEFVFRYMGKGPISVSIGEPPEEDEEEPFGPQHIVLSDAKVVVDDKNGNGVLELGEWIGVHYTMTNEHPTESAEIGYIEHTVGSSGIGGTGWFPLAPGESYQETGFTTVTQSFLDHLGPSGAYAAVSGMAVMYELNGGWLDNPVVGIAEKAEFFLP